MCTKHSHKQQIQVFTNFLQFENNFMHIGKNPTLMKTLEHIMKMLRLISPYNRVRKETLNRLPLLITIKFKSWISQ